MINLHERYFEMEERWQEIVRQPVPRAARQEACLALLIAFVDKLAAARVGQSNAPLRFFADMERLRQYLLRFDGDDLGRIAIAPSWHIVSDWLLANGFANGTKLIGSPIDVARYLDWEQLRAIMIGERPGWAALDRSRVHSEYVQSTL